MGANRRFRTQNGGKCGAMELNGGTENNVILEPGPCWVSNPVSNLVSIVYNQRVSSNNRNTVSVLRVREGGGAERDR